MSIHGFKVIVYVYGNIILPARRIYYLFTTTTIPLSQCLSIIKRDTSLNHVGQVVNLKLHWC